MEKKQKNKFDNFSLLLKSFILISYVDSTFILTKSNFLFSILPTNEEKYRNE